MGAVILTSLAGLQTFDKFAEEGTPIQMVDDVTHDIDNAWLESMIKADECNVPAKVKDTARSNSRLTAQTRRDVS